MPPKALSTRAASPPLFALAVGLGVLLLPLAVMAEAGPPPPGVTPGMKVPIFTQLAYLCGAVATVMIAIIAFLMLGKCRHRAAHLGDAPSAESVTALRRSVMATLVTGLAITGGYLYLTYYALAVLVPTIKLPRFAYMLSTVTIATAAIGAFMIFIALRARRALPPKV